jgi:hypothetical protein
MDATEIATLPKIVSRYDERARGYTLRGHPARREQVPHSILWPEFKRGLLQRAHIVANWPPVYIGKESDRHWEEGGRLEFARIHSYPVQAERERCCRWRTIGADRERSQAGIQAAWSQSAHVGKDL